MADDKTEHFGNSGSFEERVLSQLAAIGTRLGAVEAKAEEHARDTRPLFEQAIKEMQQTRTELGASFDHLEIEMRKELRALGDRLDVFAIELNKVQAGSRNMDRRLSEIEQKPA
jgi:hypothetical protein